MKSAEQYKKCFGFKKGFRFGGFIMESIEAVLSEDVRNVKYFFDTKLYCKWTLLRKYNEEDIEKSVKYFNQMAEKIRTVRFSEEKSCVYSLLAPEYKIFTTCTDDTVVFSLRSVLIIVGNKIENIMFNEN